MNKLAKTTRKWYKFTCSSVPGIVSSHYIDLRSSSQGDILIALGFPGTNLEKHWRTALTRRDEANWNLESNLVCVASDTVSMPREHISSSLSSFLQEEYICAFFSLSQRHACIRAWTKRDVLSISVGDVRFALATLAIRCSRGALRPRVNQKRARRALNAIPRTEVLLISVES